jgi:competence protein ComEA
MWETIRGYLTFTRKERNGVLFLLVLIFILFVLPYFFRPSVGDPDPETYEKIKDQIRKFESRATDSSVTNNHLPFPESSGIQNHISERARPTIFYFDPNKLSADDCQRLGLSERLTHTILHYIEKGGRFRRAEDLKKLYGIQNTDFERLYSYVRIATPREDPSAHMGYHPKTATMPFSKRSDSFFRPDSQKYLSTGGYERKSLEVIDINLADSSAWARLPGIGLKLASRIVHFREKLGGFYQVEQVGETFALTDSVFQKIKPCLQLNSISVHQIDLNTASKEELEAHPYIRWQLAKRIIDFRVQHGGFQSVSELLQLAQMDPGKFEKLKPYLVVKQ